MNYTICPHCEHINKEDPNNRLWCQKCNLALHTGPSVIFKPVWSSIPVHDSTESATGFFEARDKETKVSNKARKWEKARKAELSKHKPEWVRKGRKFSDIPR